MLMVLFVFWLVNFLSKKKMKRISATNNNNNCSICNYSSTHYPHCSSPIAAFSTTPDEPEPVWGGVCLTPCRGRGGRRRPQHTHGGRGDRSWRPLSRKNGLVQLFIFIFVIYFFVFFLFLFCYCFLKDYFVITELLVIKILP